MKLALTFNIPLPVAAVPVHAVLPGDWGGWGGDVRGGRGRGRG